MKAKLATSGGRAARLSASDAPDEEKLEEIYLAAFARKPRADELQTAIDYLNEELLDAAGNPISKQQAANENYRDIIWALMNTKEFMFNH